MIEDLNNIIKLKDEEINKKEKEKEDIFQMKINYIKKLMKNY